MLPRSPRQYYLEEMLNTFDSEILGLLILAWIWLIYKKFLYQPPTPIVDPEIWNDPAWDRPENVRMLYETICEQILKPKNKDDPFSPYSGSQGPFGSKLGSDNFGSVFGQSM